MNLDKYIIQLLAKYGTATVPGLGTFRTEHRNAELHNLTILPPGDVVVFTADPECRDNTLAEAVMRDMKIKYNKAVSLVSDSIDDVDAQSLCGWQIFLPQNFGMQSIHVCEIKHETIFQSVGRYAAAVAAAILLNISVPVNKVSDTHFAEARIVPEFFTNIERSEDTLPETAVAEVSAPKDFCVVVSSLNSREDAMNWIVTHSGCDSMEIIENDGHFRVAAARFSSYNEAASFIKNQNITAWVLHTN